MGNVSWDFTEPLVNLETIKKVEKSLGVEFPNDYLEVALVNHGGSPEPNIYDFTGHGEAVFGYLLSFNSDSEIFILDVHNDLSDRLINGIIPIADDPFGNYICYDFRKSNNPTLVYWDHEVAYENPENALSYICDNFTALIEKLYSLE